MGAAIPGVDAGIARQLNVAGQGDVAGAVPQAVEVQRTQATAHPGTAA